MAIGGGLEIKVVARLGLLALNCPDYSIFAQQMDFFQLVRIKFGFLMEFQF